MASHKEFLAGKGLNYTTAPRGVQKKMTEYNKIEAELEKVRAKIVEGISPQLKAQLEAQVQQAEEALLEIDGEVKKSNESRVAAMNKGREEKKKLKAGGQPPAPVVPIETPVPAAAAVDTPPPPAPAAPVSTEPPKKDDKDKKEDGTPWAWILGAAALVGGIFLGIKVLNDK